MIILNQYYKLRRKNFYQNYLRSVEEHKNKVGEVFSMFAPTLTRFSRQYIHLNPIFDYFHFDYQRCERDQFLFIDIVRKRHLVDKYSESDKGEYYLDAYQIQNLLTFITRVLYFDKNIPLKLDEFWEAICDLSFKYDDNEIMSEANHRTEYYKRRCLAYKLAFAEHSPKVDRHFKQIFAPIFFDDDDTEYLSLGLICLHFTGSRELALELVAHFAVDIDDSDFPEGYSLKLENAFELIEELLKHFPEEAEELALSQFLRNIKSMQEKICLQLMPLMPSLSDDQPF